MKPIIHKNVQFGKGCIFEDNVEIGRIGKSKKREMTVLGDNCHFRRGTVIYAGVRIGNDFHSGHNTLIREGNSIGNNVSVGSFTELALGNRIGNDTRIHSHCFLEDVTVGEGVFIAPGVIFTNDPHPPSPYGSICIKGATVGNGAVIGGGAVILPNITIGPRALIGAGSVVTKNVGPENVAVGNPAKKTKNIHNIVCRLLEEPHRPYENKKN